MCDARAQGDHKPLFHARQVKFCSLVGQLQVRALVGFLGDVFKVLGLVGFSLACTLLAHAVAHGLSQETDELVLFDQDVP